MINGFNKLEKCKSLSSKANRTPIEKSISVRQTNNTIPAKANIVCWVRIRSSVTSSTVSSGLNARRSVSTFHEILYRGKFACTLFLNSNPCDPSK